MPALGTRASLALTTAPLRIAVLALLWGSVFLWIDLALEGFGPVQITFARSALGAAVLVVLVQRSGERLPRGKSTWRRLLVAALLTNVVPFALIAAGQQSVDSGVAGVLNATTPLWTLAVSRLSGVERHVEPIQVVGLLIGLGGVAMIFAPWDAEGEASWGLLAIMGAAVSYALAFVYMGRFLVGGTWSPISLAAGQLLLASGVTALALPAEVASASPAVKPAIALVVLGVLGTGVTLAMFVRLIADEGATRAATVTYLLPVVALSLGAIVLDEKLGLRRLGGMAVVLGGVALSRKRRVDVRRETIAYAESERPPPDDLMPRTRRLRRR